MSDFVPGPSARDLWDEIQNKGKLEAFEMILDDMYPDGLSDTGLNDLLRFDDDWIRDVLEMPETWDEDEDEDRDDERMWGDPADLNTYDDSEDDELQNDLLAEQNEQQ